MLFQTNPSCGTEKRRSLRRCRLQQRPGHFVIMENEKDREGSAAATGGGKEKKLPALISWPLKLAVGKVVEWLYSSLCV